MTDNGVCRAAPGKASGSAKQALRRNWDHCIVLTFITLLTWVVWVTIDTK